MARLFATIAALFLISCEEDSGTAKPEQVASYPLFRIAALTDSTYLSTSDPRGQITLVQYADRLEAFIQLENMPPNGVHAVHLHNGSCETPLDHWNAGQTGSFCNTRSLGIAWSKPFAGDLGNVSVGYDGTGEFSIQTDLWNMKGFGPNDLSGLIVVVHEKSENFTDACDPNGGGHSHGVNQKIACGMIE